MVPFNDQNDFALIGNVPVGCDFGCVGEFHTPLIIQVPAASIIDKSPHAYGNSTALMILPDGPFSDLRLPRAYWKGRTLSGEDSRSPFIFPSSPMVYFKIYDPLNVWHDEHVMMKLTGLPAIHPKFRRDRGKKVLN